MKILQINKYHYLRAGAERAVFDVSRLLTAKGHEVVPFAMHHPENVPTPWSRFFVSERQYDRRNGIAADLEKAAEAIGTAAATTSGWRVQ